MRDLFLASRKDAQNPALRSVFRHLEQDPRKLVHVNRPDQMVVKAGCKRAPAVSLLAISGDRDQNRPDGLRQGARLFG